MDHDHQLERYSISDVKPLELDIAAARAHDHILRVLLMHEAALSTCSELVSVINRRVQLCQRTFVSLSFCHLFVFVFAFVYFLFVFLCLISFC